MREVLYAFGLFAIIGLIGLVAFLDPVQVMAWSQTLMVWGVTLAAPFELAYFAGLGRALHRTDAPRGWYWRSFDHHKALGPRERYLVLGCFAVGSTLMALASLAVVVVIAALLASLRS